MPVIPPVSWSSLLPNIASGDVVLFSKTDELGSRVLMDVTDCPYSHVAMIVRTHPGDEPMIWQAAPQPLAADPDHHDVPHSGAQLSNAAEVLSELFAPPYSMKAYHRSLSMQRSSEFEATLADVVAKLDGVPFPTIAEMVGHAAEGRFLGHDSGPTSMFCAQLVAKTMQLAGVLGDEHPSNWYNQGSFCSKGIYADDCVFLRGATWAGPEQEIASPLS